MRAVLFILILAVVAVLIAVATGFLDISQTREAKAPQISATANGVTARGGQTPTFDVETGSVSVSTRQANVPALQVNPPESKDDQSANAVSNTAANVN